MFCVCICSLRYPACNMHAPYCHLWSARLCNAFPCYLINVTFFREKKVTGHNMCVLIFSTTWFQTFHVLRRREKDAIRIYIYIYMATGWTVRRSSPGGDEIFRICLDRPWAHPATCTMNTGSFPGVESIRGVTLTPHPLLVPRSKNRVSYTTTLRKGLRDL
jgi:hypothetical protein